MQIHTLAHTSLHRSGMAYCIVTFEDLTLAVKAFEAMQVQRFVHRLQDGKSFDHWCSVKWFHGQFE